MRWLLALIAVFGCGADRIAETDEVYYSWEGRRVLCGVSIDNRLDVALDDFREGMERAREREEVLVFYGHKIGTGKSAVTPERLESILQLAQDAELPFLTFPELHGEPPADRAGVVVTFDDAYIDSWYSHRDLFAAYDARATFFTTRFAGYSEEDYENLHELLALGHAVENHGTNHQNAPDYARELGIQAYVEDEVVSTLDAMRSEGFSPTTFAYPYGARTGELDEAILEHVELVRSLSWLFASHALVQDPCPE